MSAQTVPNYGMRPVGGFGIRGFRAHCRDCGYLSKFYLNYGGARSNAVAHKCPEQAAA